MKGDETTKEGLETLERVLGAGNAGKTSEGRDKQEESEEPDGTEADGAGADSEETGSAAGPSEAGKPDAPRETPSTPKKGTPVFVYLAVMFAAAFLMLLLAYFIQERNNAAQIGNLQSAMESIQSIDELIEENRQLREELESQKEEYSRMSDEYSSMQEQLRDTLAYVERLGYQKRMGVNMFLLENLMQQERYHEAAYLLNLLVAYLNGHEYEILDYQTAEMANVHFNVEARLLVIASQLRELGYDIVERQLNGNVIPDQTQEPDPDETHLEPAN